MKLTKYEHACFTVEEQGSKVIVDPGMFTDLPADLSGVTAVVVTHEHGDHFVPEQLDKIRAVNPEVQIFGAEEVAARYAGASVPERGKVYQAGPFALEFGGEFHAQIDPAVPAIHNLTVSINGTLYYPGDSYTPPSGMPKVIMIPLNAPWAKISETLEFYTSAPAELFIATHDALLSDIGHNVYDLSQRAEGRTYRYLRPGESLEL